MYEPREHSLVEESKLHGPPGAPPDLVGGGETSPGQRWVNGRTGQSREWEAPPRAAGGAQDSRSAPYRQEGWSPVTSGWPGRGPGALLFMGPTWCARPGQVFSGQAAHAQGTAVSQVTSPRPGTCLPLESGVYTCPLPQPCDTVASSCGSARAPETAADTG